MDGDMLVSRRGKGEYGEAELESECDRQAEEEEEEKGGGGDVEELSQTPPSSPDFSVKDTVLIRWIACALAAKACPRQ